MKKPEKIKYEISISYQKLSEVIEILKSEIDKNPDYNLKLVIEKEYGSDFGDGENSWAAAIIEGTLKK
jgi:hypothetical protein